jgi:hypothetical protein
MDFRSKFNAPISQFFFSAASALDLSGWVRGGFHNVARGVASNSFKARAYGLSAVRSRPFDFARVISATDVSVAGRVGHVAWARTVFSNFSRSRLITFLVSGSVPRVVNTSSARGPLIALANTRETASKSAGDRFQAERARILQRNFRRIAAGSQPVCRELRKMARRWKGKRVAGRPLRLSLSTLTRIYFAWRKTGGAALAHNYKPARSKVPSAIAREFLKECLAPGVTSRAEAIRVLKLGKGGAYSADSFYRVFPRALKQKLSALHRARLAAWRIEAALRKEIGC